MACTRGQEGGGKAYLDCAEGDGQLDLFVVLGDFVLRAGQTAGAVRAEELLAGRYLVRKLKKAGCNVAASAVRGSRLAVGCVRTGRSDSSTYCLSFDAFMVSRNFMPMAKVVSGVSFSPLSSSWRRSHRVSGRGQKCSGGVLGAAVREPGERARGACGGLGRGACG